MPLIPPPFKKMLLTLEFKKCLFLGGILLFVGVAMILPLVFFFIPFPEVIYLDRLAMYSLLAAGGIAVTKIAWSYLLKAYSEFNYASLICRCESVRLVDTPQGGYSKDSYPVEFIKSSGDVVTLNFSNSEGESLFGSSWAKDRDGINRLKSLPVESRQQYREFSEMRGKVSSLMSQQGYDEYEIDNEMNSLKQMENDYLDLLLYQFNVKSSISQAKRLSAGLNMNRPGLSIKKNLGAAQGKLYNDTLLLEQERDDKKGKKEELLVSIGVELVNLQNQISLIQDSLLLKGRTVSVADKKYCSSPLLAELRESLADRSQPQNA